MTWAGQPGTIESLPPAGRRGRVLKDYGWGSDRAVWRAYELSRRMVAQGYADIPTAMRGIVDGEFSLDAADGAAFGYVKIRGGCLTDLGSFFRRRGAEQGDHLVLVLDLASRRITGRPGDAGPLDELRTGLPRQPQAAELGTLTSSARDAALKGHPCRGDT